MEAFIAGDQLVGEGQAGHELPLLEPENGTEGSAEKDTFDGTESHQSHGERIRIVDVLHGPAGLLLNDRNGLDRIKQEILFRLILDEGVDQEGIGLRMDVFHGDLEAIEASGFGHLNLGAEILG